VRVYVEVARRAFARQATYRVATAAGVFTNTVFAFLMAYVLLAVYGDRPVINGFGAADAVTFTFVAQGLFSVVALLAGSGEQSSRIKTGAVAVDLYRPVDYQGYWAAMSAGEAAYSLVFRGIPPVVIGVLLFDGVRLPPGPQAAVGFAASVVLALAASASFRFVLESLAFWLLDARGPAQIVHTVAGFLSGSFVPTFLFPPALLAANRFLPFEAMLQWPIEVYLGARTGAGLAATLAAQAAWAVALAAGARLVLRRAVRKVVVQGG
jgi:ABC-2 type transport system permease protein